MDFMVALPTIVRAMAMGAVPILLAALGEVFSERAGLVNIGLEGIMAVGAFVAFAVGKAAGNLWLGLLVGMLAGVAINMIYAFCAITLCSDQTVTSMAVNILAPAIALFGYNLFVGSNSENATGAQMASIAIPGLSDIPIIGNGLFNQSALAYITFLLVPLVAFFFKRCRFGLSFRSVGENPQAAETLGINVIAVKYLACALCGALAAAGGAFLTICYTPIYTDGIVAGRGFIALATVIFGRWSAVGVMLASLLFGFFDGLNVALQASFQSAPVMFFKMIPYIFTIVALVFFGSRHGGPKACGKPYFRESR
ncbi:ABC transporter permease [Paratractidigestivibacter sp.]|uniref:ABC transporter permease n=1 Tax=Paratractidigestivibacter sp. TaxID=2847316 RepID=UPI002AC9ED39|nr:ABC transporter permease [Paratractidigestivibacter sp.]